VLDLCDRIGPTLSEPDRAAAAARFATTARYEWMFWEMGLRQESWPV
jgi:thiaminase/transcriptional activator TenA